MNKDDIQDLIDYIPLMDGYTENATLMDIESALVTLQERVRELENEKGSETMKSDTVHKLVVVITMLILLVSIFALAISIAVLFYIIL